MHLFETSESGGSESLTNCVFQDHKWEAFKDHAYEEGNQEST
jgi:hypothetical protein